jgi:hypothetical protein
LFFSRVAYTGVVAKNLSQEQPMPRLVFTNTAGSDIAVGNADGYGKSFSIPVAGATVTMTGTQLASATPQLEAMKAKGYLSWVLSQDPAVDDELELMSGVPQALLVPAVVPAAKSVTAIHAALAGSAANLFPGPITNPVTPRNASAVAASGYTGGDLTLVGTNMFDAAQTEVITPVAGSTVYGTKIWKTITSITKASVGAAATISVGTGDKIGVGYNVANSTGLMYVGGVLEAVTVDPVADAWTATSVPNGTLSFVALLNVQAS